MDPKPFILMKIRKYWLIIVYLILLAVTSAVILWQRNYDWILFLFLIPVLFTALNYSRRIYVLLAVTLLAAALIVMPYTAQKPAISTGGVVLVAAVTLIASELIYFKTNQWRELQASLEASQAKYMMVFRSNPDVIIVTRVKDGVVLEVNESFERQTGHSAAEAVGKSILDLDFWAYPEEREKMIEEIRTRGSISSFECTMRNRWGEVHTSLISARMIEWQGEAWVISIIRNITERKQMEEVLRQSEARNKALLNAIPDTMFRLSRSGIYLDFLSHNPGGTDKGKEFIGKHLAEVLPADVAAESLRAVQETLSTGQTQRIEYHLDRHNKSRDFEARLAASSPEEVLAIVRDITERKKSDLLLRQAEERYRHLVEQIESIIYVCNRDEQRSPIYISPQVENVLGYRAEEWLQGGADIWEKCMHPDDAPRVMEAYRQANESGGSFRMEYRLKRKDGCIVWLEDHASLASDEQGNLTRWQGVCLDTTARKRSELVQSATYRIAQAALAAQNLDEFFDAVHDVIFELIPASNMYIATYDPKSGLLSFPFWSDEHDPRPLPQKPIRGLTEYVMRSRESQLVDHVRFQQLAASGEIYLTDIGTMSVDWLGTPLIIADEVIGVLVVQSYSSSSRLGKNEQNILEFISGQIAMTIDRMQAEEALRESEDRYSLAVRGANDGIWDWDLRSNTVYYSARWKSMIGLMDDGFGNTPDDWFSRIHPQDLERVMNEISAHLKGDTGQFECEYRLMHENGEYRWMKNSAIAVRNPSGQALRMAGSMTDITQRKNAEERLLHDAMHDPLTNLPNRAYFINLLSLMLERIRRRSDYRAAVLFLDLDRFKIVNESLGHNIGDLLLSAVAERVQGCLRPGDTLARFGGDEYAVLLEDLKTLSEASHIASLIQSRLAPPFNFQGHEVFTSVTIGIIFVDDHYEQAEELMRDVDSATYRAKEIGRGRIEIFNSDMHTASMSALQLEADLRRAIERQEFRLYFQPIISLRDRKVRSFEALLRWQHPLRGIIMPGEFVSLAEDNGLIIPIGEWVLRTACQQIKVWQKAGFHQMKVSVNISARQLQETDLASLVSSALQESGVDGSNLQLEITEYTAMRDQETTTRILNEITQMGVEILIDDFGTGYSSMGYLKRFPVSYLKIAQTFIRDVTNDPDDAAITTAIIALAHAMNMRVVAEGVENQAQFSFLLEHDCDEIQGYYINPAMPSVSTTRFLQGGLEERMGSM